MGKEGKRRGDEGERRWGHGRGNGRGTAGRGGNWWMEALGGDGGGGVRAVAALGGGGDRSETHTQSRIR